MKKEDSKSKIELKILFLFIALFMYGLFGLSFVVGKKTLQFGGPFILTAMRMILASIILFGVQFIVDRKKMVSPKGYWPEIILISIFNIYFTNVLEFWGLQFLASYETCYVYSLSPFLAACLSFLVLKEKLGTMKIVGLCIALIGFLPLLLYKGMHEGQKLYISCGQWALLGAVFATVIGWVVMRRLVYQKKYPLLMANAYSMFFGGIIAYFTSWIFEGLHPFPVSNWRPFLYGMVTIALINNILGYNLYAYLTKKFTVTLMSFLGFVTPLITAFFGWIFLGESVTLLFFISYGIVLVGFWIFSRQEIVYGVK